MHVNRLAFATRILGLSARVSERGVSPTTSRNDAEVVADAARRRLQRVTDEQGGPNQGKYPDVSDF